MSSKGVPFIRRRHERIIFLLLAAALILLILRGPHVDARLHKLCVIVPFRDRLLELQEFVPGIHNFLFKQGIVPTIVIVDQQDEYRFNRGALLNVGVRRGIEVGCDYFALQDVDLIPADQRISYAYPSTPVHLAPPGLHPKYTFRKFFGGAHLISLKDYQLLNGYTNKLWGWGGEDDEFRLRSFELELEWERPPIAIDGSSKETSWIHIHGEERPRDKSRPYGQDKLFKVLDTDTGLHNVAYTVKEETELIVNGYPVIHYQVLLHCDEFLTPWCRHAVDGDQEPEGD
eukprot:Clim_evm219s157 gene=Clim_evmTU219s157